MYTASYRLVVVALALVSVSWAAVDDEHKCLKMMPGDQCDIDVAFQGKQAGCVNLVKNSQTQPTLKCQNITLAGKDVLILMIDHDLFFSHLSANGYIHWAAKGKVTSDGCVTITSNVNGTGYVRPNPACCNAHHYDMLLFSFDNSRVVDILKGTKNNRIDKLCDFMKRNKLALPIAAMSLRVISPDA